MAFNQKDTELIDLKDFLRCESPCHELAIAAYPTVHPFVYKSNNTTDVMLFVKRRLEDFAIENELEFDLMATVCKPCVIYARRELVGAPRSRRPSMQDHDETISKSTTEGLNTQKNASDCSASDVVKSKNSKPKMRNDIKSQINPKPPAGVSKLSKSDQKNNASELVEINSSKPNIQLNPLNDSPIVQPVKRANDMERSGSKKDKGNVRQSPKKGELSSSKTASKLQKPPVKRNVGGKTRTIAKTRAQSRECSKLSTTCVKEDTSNIVDINNSKPNVQKDQQNDNPIMQPLKGQTKTESSLPQTKKISVKPSPQKGKMSPSIIAANLRKPPVKLNVAGETRTNAKTRAQSRECSKLSTTCLKEDTSKLVDINNSAIKDGVDEIKSDRKDRQRTGRNKNPEDYWITVPANLLKGMVLREILSVIANGDQTCFVVRFAGNEDLQLINRADANVHFPQKVIAFYSQLIKWSIPIEFQSGTASNNKMDSSASLNTTSENDLEGNEDIEDMDTGGTDDDVIIID